MDVDFSLDSNSRFRFQASKTGLEVASERRLLIRLNFKMNFGNCEGFWPNAPHGNNIAIPPNHTDNGGFAVDGHESSVWGSQGPSNGCISSFASLLTNNRRDNPRNNHFFFCGTPIANKKHAAKLGASAAASSQRTSLTSSSTGSGLQNQHKESQHVSASLEAAKSQVDDLLRHEFSKLSVNEREKALTDFYGEGKGPAVATVNVDQIDARLTGTRMESEPHTSEKLVELEEAITSLVFQSEESKKYGNRNNDVDMTAYNIALQTNPVFIRDLKLRLMFLRSCDFEPQKAAVRFINFLTQKYELFDRDLYLLTKNITFNDLDEGSKRSVLNGHFQCLGKDQSQRHVVVANPLRRAEESQLGITPKNAMRALYYRMMTLLLQQDVTDASPIHEVTTIFYIVGQPLSILADRLERGKQMMALKDSLPCKYVRNFCCFDNAVLYHAIPSWIHMIQPFVRRRLQLVCGTYFPLLH